jgi:hypothetical protein
MTVIAEQDDAKLAAQIVVAIKALDAANDVRKAKAIIAGNLLAEAQKRHPGKKAFEKFLELAGGIPISRAQTLIAIALGRKDFEQHQDENAKAQQRHRDKRRDGGHLGKLMPATRRRSRDHQAFSEWPDCGSPRSFH